MAKRDKRNSRFNSLKTIYDMYKAGLLTDEQAKQHITFAKENNGTVIFASEFEKFAETYQEDVTNGKLVMSEFETFMKVTGGLKKAGSAPKKDSGEPTAPKTRLNTPEAAVERGVAPENIDTYLNAVNTIYAQSRILNDILTKARASFAIPVFKEKVEAVAEVETT